MNISYNQILNAIDQITHMGYDHTNKCGNVIIAVKNSYPRKTDIFKIVDNRIVKYGGYSECPQSKEREETLRTLDKVWGKMKGEKPEAVESMIGEAVKSARNL